MAADFRLYGYWRSSSSWRVRAALAHKGLTWETVPVHLIAHGGEQHLPEFRARNPMEQVPLLEIFTPAGPVYLGQSMAIVEYLEEQYPTPSLFPADALGRARARQLAEIVNSGIQPLQNLGVIEKLRDELGQDAKAWCAHWIARGLDAFTHTLVQGPEGEFCVGDEVSVADMFLVPQLYNARRFGVDLSEFPRLLAIEQACLALEAFQKSHPDAQPDAQP